MSSSGTEYLTLRALGLSPSGRVRLPFRRERLRSTPLTSPAADSFFPAFTRATVSFTAAESGTRSRYRIW